MLSLVRTIAVGWLALSLLGGTPYHGHASGVGSHGVPLAPAARGWQRFIYGGATVPGGFRQPPTHIDSYSLAYPPSWSSQLWPDSLATYGQLDLQSPTGTAITIVLIPLRPHGPTLSALMAHDKIVLSALRQSDVDDMRGRLNAQTTKRQRGQAHDERVDALTTRRVRVHDEDQGLMDASEGQESAQALVQHPVVQALIQATVEQATAPLVAQIAGKDATIERQAEELGAARERARQAEERAAQLERAVRRQQRPWWLRLLG